MTKNKQLYTIHAYVKTIYYKYMTKTNNIITIKYSIDMEKDNETF